MLSDARSPWFSPDIPTEARFVFPSCPRSYYLKWEPNTWRVFSGCPTECSSTSIEASARSTCLSVSAVRPKFPSSPYNREPDPVHLPTLGHKTVRTLYDQSFVILLRRALQLTWVTFMPKNAPLQPQKSPIRNNLSTVKKPNPIALDQSCT